MFQYLSKLNLSVRPAGYRPGQARPTAITLSGEWKIDGDRHGRRLSSSWTGLAVRVMAALVLVSGVLGGASAAELEGISDQDWPWWRGPRWNGSVVGTDPAKLPMDWQKAENLRWMAEIPGRGHSSPTVVGSHVYLTTAEPEGEKQSVLCFERTTGRLLWQTLVHEGGFPDHSNAKSSHASPTVACDGERLYVNFMSHGAVTTTALSRDGKILWNTKISNYIVHQGYGSSPLLYDDLVIVTAENKGGGAVAALEKATGKIVWRLDRPKLPNYPSPMVVQVAQRDQLILVGADMVWSLAPRTGEKLWEMPGATTECVASTLTDGTHIFTSGGYPRNHMAAIKADGSREIAWENTERVYVPSLLIRDRYLYGVLDAGVAMCWEAATGKEQWKKRLGGTFTASPVLIDDHILAVNEAGQAFLYEAQPNSFQLRAETKIGDEVYATPTVAGAQIFVRYARFDGSTRQEYLTCIAAP